jgi:hypothetical protein
MVTPLHPHPEVDDFLARVDETIPEEQPTQTDNRPRPEDGDQSEVDQKILAPGGSPQ